MAEWLKATDCKSVPERVRWFESTPAQVLRRLRKGSFFIAGMILTTVVVLSSIAVFNCPVWSEVFFVIARAKVQINPAFADFKWSEVCKFKLLEK